jgi:hypothetical protein
MSFAHIYKRKDGRCTARCGGEVASTEGMVGTVRYDSQRGAFPNVESAAHWIRLAVSTGRVASLPEPTIFDLTDMPDAA